MMNDIPVINIRDLLYCIEQAESEALNRSVKAIAGEIQQAMRHSGFFYVSGFTLDTSVIRHIQVAQQSFFALPVEIKNQSAINTDNRGYLASGMAKMHGARQHDQKEVFFWGAELAAEHPLRQQQVALCGPNNWPEQPVNFKDAVLTYSEQIRTIGNALLRAIAHSLNVKDNFFEHYYNDSLLRGQLLRYPETKGDKDAFGVAPHTDFGCITLLLQTTPGLEVKTRNGEWIEAPPIHDTLVINIGDLLARWSDNRLPTNVHRVRNTSTAERFSIAMFHDPNPTALIAPADMKSDNCGYEPVRAADYILGRNSGAFSHYGNLEAAKD
ncbi:MAG: isopenicillin N synthase-like dioxygenase [Granulosicoccus sp.]|jgi:isopenicillin N synthase-like dioxygenase